MAERPTCNGGTTKLGRLFQECLVPARFELIVRPDIVGGTLRTRHACSRHLVQLVTRMARPGQRVLVERLTS